MKKHEYYVEIPLTGTASGTVVASSEEEAIELFAEECTINDVEWGVDASRGDARQGEEVEDDEENNQTPPAPIKGAFGSTN